MTLTISINNGLSLVHKGSDGVSTATLPDVCKTPPGPVPVPYPNISFSKDLAKGTTTVFADGGNPCANLGSEFSRSIGDEPGVAGGVISGVNMKESTWITYSFDVKLEGKNACRLTDKKFQNHMNTVDMAGEIQKALGVSDADFKTVCKNCIATADDDIAWAQKMQQEYAKAGSNPANKTGADIERDLQQSLAGQGIATTTAGTTDNSGNVVVNPQPGPCGRLEEASTAAHENEHAAHTKSLENQYGKGTQAFHNVWNSASDWWQDEMQAYQKNIDFMKKFKAECNAANP